MSNVLIGIIGVILFIGLALAGALILGDDFRSSKSSTSAATVTGQLQQVVSGINMYQLKTGQQMLASTHATNIATLQPRFLKTAPINPIVATNTYATVEATGGISTNPADSVVVSLGPNSRDTCKAIEEQAGAADPEAQMANQTVWTTALAARRTVGCFLWYGNYVAFAKV